MDAFFTHEEGPGAIAWPPTLGRPTVEAIIAPHIDFHRGGPAYAWAYRDLAERCAADLFVIVGTCHVGGMNFVLVFTQKGTDVTMVVTASNCPAGSHTIQIGRPPMAQFPCGRPRVRPA